MTHRAANLLLSEPLLALGVSLDERGLGLDRLADGGLFALSLDVLGVLPNGSVGSLIEIGDLLALKNLLPLGELLLELGGVLALEKIVVSLDVVAQDVVQVLLSVEFHDGLDLLLSGSATLPLASSSLFLLETATRETSLVVRDVQTSVAGTLHGTKDSVTGGCARKTDVEVRLEGASLAILRADVVQLAIGVGHTDEGAIKLLVLEQSAGKEEASGVSSSVVGETTVDSELLELEGVGGGDGHVTLEGGVDDRGDDALVGHADDHAVLLAVVLVLVVDGESLASLVVGFALSSASELGLIPLRVCFVLEILNVAHPCI